VIGRVIFLLQAVCRCRKLQLIACLVTLSLIDIRMSHAIRGLHFTLRIRPIYFNSTIRTMGSYRAPVRKFAPLDPTAMTEIVLPKLEGIIFDVDGTLCESLRILY
jgi:hypothetical protein